MVQTNVSAEPGKPEIVVTKVFDAPAERVFKVYADPKLLTQWWGMEGHDVVVEKMDVTPGGAYRVVDRGPQGEVFGLHGVYHAVVPPHWLAATLEFENLPGHVGLETATFEERDGKTTLTEKSIFQTVEDRDRMLKSDMQKSVDYSAERMAALVQ